MRDGDQEQLVREAEQVEMQLAAGSEAIAIRSRPADQLEGDIMLEDFVYENYTEVVPD